MIHIEPLHTGTILPAFVIGYELPQSAGPLMPPRELPPWIVTVDQQAGGLCMTYPSVVGAVLRLEANLDRGKMDLGRLIRGLRCMAEDPDMDTLRREYPVLGRLVLTHGNEYSKGELRDLGNILASHLWVPPLQGGIEAFLSFAPCDPLDCFCGWRVLRCAFRTEGPLWGSIYAFPDSDTFHVDESNLSDLDLADDVVYDGDRQRELMKLGEELARPESPDVFFLWENSD